MLKIYKLLFYYTATYYFFIDGKEVFVNFKGTKDNKGTFVTKDKTLQDAIEADSKFNKEFYIFYEEKEKVETINSAEESATEGKETAKNEEKELKSVTAKNLQGIDDLVKKLFPYYGKSFKSSEKAVAFFAERGYKLEIG